MPRSKLSWILPLLFLAASVLAQPTPVTPETLWAGGDGKFESAPDTALVQFSISVQQSKLKDAYAQARESAEKIRQTLRDNGIDPKAAEIGSFSMTPVYSWSGKRSLVGFQVNSHVTVKVHDFSKLDELIESFSQVDKTDGLNLSYTLLDIESAKAKAVEDAYRKAHLAAETLARAGDRSLGTMSYASVDVSVSAPQPRPIMYRAQAEKNEVAAPSPIQDFAPGQITTTAHVNVLFHLK
jgi:uncharacterized protein YggE